MLKQHDFFANQPFDEIGDLRNSNVILEERLKKLEASHEKVRRCLFAKIDWLENNCIELQYQLSKDF